MALSFFGDGYSYGQMVLPKEGSLGEVWISGYEFAHNIPELNKHGIKAVCSAVDLKFNYPEHISNIKFDLDDCTTQDARYAFEPSYNFIEEQRYKTNVLVHCAAGISRCSTLLIAYMTRKYRWGFHKCLALLQGKRKCCCPNSGFQKQLIELEGLLGIDSKKEENGKGDINARGKY